ncbi:hypothetical protein DL96DRAFT_1559948 [Flagelloscypha sp. PMI_526]|nr:hypothetical protein DL96DRAFT_1559948 [Flagelloscypha sp. PMI_526]
MSAPAVASAAPTSTPTPIAGTTQAKDVEANVLPPSVPQPKFRIHIPWKQIGRISLVVGICIAILATCCLIFFSSVAIGRVIFLHHGHDEYISSALGGGFFLLIAAVVLFFLYAALDSKWDFDDDDDALWIVLVFCMLIFGPACVALSTEVLRVTHIVNVAVKDVVLHYIVGFLVMLGGTLVCTAVFAMCGGD